MTVWRRWRLEAFLGLFAALDSASVWFSDAPHRVTLAVVTGLSVLVLCARRYAPLTAGIASFLLLALATAMGPLATATQFFGMVLSFLVVGLVVRGSELLVAASAGVALLAYGTFGLPTGGGWPDFGLSTAICGGALVAGALMSKRSSQVERMRAEAAFIDERERWRTREALRDERARIARELHDVVSHGLSVVVVQSQAARSALADPACAAAVERHLDAVESTAREGLVEMRRMLGLLQLNDPDAEQEALDPPNPGLGALDGLIQRAGQAGLVVVAHLPAPATQLPAGLELAVYRLVQEALTNVLRHAPGAQTRVQVTLGGADVEVRVTNAPVAGPHRFVGHTGHGLVGMRERVRMYGGQLRAGPIEDGSFEVHAVLPVDVERLLGTAP